MASLNWAQTRAILAKGIVGYVADDQGVAIRMKYVGTGAITSVTTTTATNIVTVTTGTGEGTKTYAFATYTTIGSLVDAINADGIFQARVLDALRSDATATQFIDGAITAGTVNGTSYYDVLVDASAAQYLAYCLAPDREVGMNVKLRDQHRVNLQEIITNVTLGGGADANGLKIYERTPSDRGSVETLIMAKTPTSGSAATINWASGYGKITAGNGNSLIVRVYDATSTTGSITITGLIE